MQDPVSFSRSIFYPKDSKPHMLIRGEITSDEESDISEEEGNVNKKLKHL